MPRIPFMRRLCLQFPVLVFLWLALTGCGKTPPPSPAQESAGVEVRLVDDLGRTVVLREKPESVVSLAPSVTEMLVALGEAGKLRGVTQWCTHPAVSGVERIGNMTSPDLERILSIHPCLVVGTEMTPRHVYDSLEGAGIPCVVFKHKDLRDVMDDMRSLARLLGDEEAGTRVLAAMDSRRSALAKSLAGEDVVSVALAYDLDTMGSAGKGSWVDDMLASVKLDNIANRAASAWPRLSREALLSSQPRYLLLPLPDDPAEAAALRARIAGLRNDAYWRQVAAVREGRVLLVPQFYLNIPGPRTLDAMEYLNRAVRGVPNP